MRGNAFLLILLLVVSTIDAQIVKFSSGMSVSSMPSRSEVLNRYIAKYYTSVGCDYLEHKYFYLSSEFAYTSLGGRGNNGFINLSPTRTMEMWNYLHLNTTFRVRYSFDQIHLYLGCGPKLDILVDDDKFKSPFFSNLEGYRMDNLSFGGKLEMGGAYDYRKICLGLNVSYLLNIGSVGVGGDTGYLKFHRSAFLLVLSIGYKI